MPGCGPAYRSGRNLVTNALAHDPLSLGFAVAFGTRNTLGTGCNDVVSAETVVMIKERFIERYGIPQFTIGSGGSGGAIQQHLIAHNYPGLLDALTPGISYPDVASILPDVADCEILNRYFDTVANPANWPGSRRTAVDGYAVASTGRTVCQNGWGGFSDGLLNPSTRFDAVVPVEVRYHPIDNPTGVRATFFDGLVNVFGVDRQTGFARSALPGVRDGEDRRGRPRGRRHPEVRPEVHRLQEVRRDVHGRGAAPAEGDLPPRRLQLLAARREAEGARGDLDRLHRRCAVGLRGPHTARARVAEHTPSADGDESADPAAAIAGSAELHRDQKLRGSVRHTQRPSLTTARNDELAPWCLSGPKLTSGPLKMSL